MIFDDTSLLDDLSNENAEQENADSLMEQSLTGKRNNKLREDFFNKYKFMYSGTNHLQSASIEGSLKSILISFGCF